MLSKLGEEYRKFNMLSDTDFPLCVQLVLLVQKQKPKTDKNTDIKKYIYIYRNIAETENFCEDKNFCW
jgi:hypothetical protein